MAAKYDHIEMLERLKKLLEERDLKPSHASTAAGLGSSYISNMFRNQSDPQVGTLKALADSLEVSTAWLMYGHDVPKGAEEIFQLLEDNPERTEAVLALLRPKS